MPIAPITHCIASFPPFIIKQNQFYLFATIDCIQIKLTSQQAFEILFKYSQIWSFCMPSHFFVECL